MATPQWAEELAARVCADYKRTPPTINWRQSHIYKLSSGTTYPGKSKTGKQLYTRKAVKGTMFGRLAKDHGHIAITAGSDEQDQKLLLLHELSHWIMCRVKPHGHDRKFWDLAYQMYSRYGVDLEYALSREKNYRQGAAAAAYARMSK